MSCFQLSWNIHHEHTGLSIKEFLKLQHISKQALTDIKFAGGSIMVNGKEETVRYVLQVEDTLVVMFPPEEISQGLIQDENIPLNIVYEDDYILVINKPAGMNTIPSREHPTGSLAQNLIAYYQTINLQATTHIVTRLDRDTSGLVLVAKHRHVHHLFSKLQKNAEVKRTYEAMAHGCFIKKEDTIEEPIGRRSDSIIEREVRRDGQYAKTNYFVLKVYPHFTHVRLQLETGRTHQIRVHLSYIGHPLLGDELYGGTRDLIARQALHCRHLSFFHPFLKEKLEFEAALPEDMQALL